MLVVQVAGAVVHPGRLLAAGRVARGGRHPGGRRLLAGRGPAAAETKLNLAAKLQDAQLIVVPRLGDASGTAPRRGRAERPHQPEHRHGRAAGHAARDRAGDGREDHRLARASSPSPRSTTWSPASSSPPPRWPSSATRSRSDSAMRARPAWLALGVDRRRGVRVVRAAGRRLGRGRHRGRGRGRGAGRGRAAAPWLAAGAVWRDRWRPRRWGRRSSPPVSRSGSCWRVEPGRARRRPLPDGAGPWTAGVESARTHQRSPDRHGRSGGSAAPLLGAVPGLPAA